MKSRRAAAVRRLAGCLNHAKTWFLESATAPCTYETAKNRVAGAWSAQAVRAGVDAYSTLNVRHSVLLFGGARSSTGSWPYSLFFSAKVVFIKNQLQYPRWSMLHTAADDRRRQGAAAPAAQEQAAHLARAWQCPYTVRGAAQSLCMRGCSRPRSASRIQTPPLQRRTHRTTRLCAAEAAEA